MVERLGQDGGAIRIGLTTASEFVKARAAFAEFVSKNPESPLRKDADQALAQLQTSK